MRHRGHLSAEERRARSRLAQLCGRGWLIGGGLVRMARTCGKEGCRCSRGAKHVSLYLSTRVGKRRRMIYIPRAGEKPLLAGVANWKEVKRLLQEVSEACLQRLLEEAERRPRP